MGLPQAHVGGASPPGDVDTTFRVYIPKFSLRVALPQEGQRVSALRDQEVSTSNWFPQDWHRNA